ncbi:MAG: LysR family transcriptional regulator [Candidatus Flexifilum sp.]
MIDLHKLHIFHIVAREGSFSAAAGRLFITQSAVSQHMKDLEIGLGQPLFQRGWRGVRLTPAGEVLADYAARIFALIAEAESALSDVQNLESGKVVIGATPGVSAYLAPGWVAQFRARYPRLTVSVSTGVTGQIAADVLAGRLDLGLIEGELDDAPPRLTYCVLEQVEQMVVVGEGHPLWDVPSVSPADLRAHSIITRQTGSQTRSWLEQALRQQGIEPQISAEFDNLESIKRAVAAGGCLTLLPAYVVADEVARGLLRTIPVEGTPFTRELKLIWTRGTPFSPPARAFISVLAQLYPAACTIMPDA